MRDIKEIELFASLGDRTCRRYGPALSWRDYAENELVIDIDDTTNDVLFIVSGLVRVVHRADRGKDVILSELGPGAYFGEMAAIDGLARSANVTALLKSRVATMRAAAFQDILVHEPDVCRSVLNMLVARVRTLNRKLSEHAYLTAVERLYCELLRLSRERDVHEGQRCVSPPPTQQELAERIGSRREVVSRAINALEKQNVLAKTRGALVLLDPGELNRRISEKGALGGYRQRGLRKPSRCRKATCLQSTLLAPRWATKTRRLSEGPSNVQQVCRQPPIERSFCAFRRSQNRSTPGDISECR